MREREPRRRSETVRRKLNQESQSSVRQAVRRAIDPPVVQPRAGAARSSHPRSAVPSSEEFAAVKRRLKPGWRLLSLALVGVFSYLLFTAWRSPDYRVSSIRIEGLQHLTQEEVLAKVNVLGQHIFAVQPQEIQSAIAAAFPELRDIKVRVSLPAGVTISVVERQPMFIWQMKNSVMWIDTEGYLIPARGASPDLLTISADSLPVYQLEKDLSGEESTLKIIQDKSIDKPGLSDLTFFAQSKHIDSSLLLGILQLNAWMPAEKTLLYQKQRGLGWADARGWDVFVGRKLENINDKMVMYETIVRNLESQGINPSMVSVEFLNAPYYRVD
jgi:Cell division septal protein